LESLFYSQLAIPIHKPAFELTVLPNKNSDFTFDSGDRFIDYSFHSEQNHVVSCDDKGQWYLFTSIPCETLEKLKLARQLFRPSYLKAKSLPLIGLLESLNLTPINEGFDKAYAHVLYYVPSLKEVPNYLQIRVANVDGPDDPSIVHQIHFIENEYKGQKTRYIPGAETKSFATITENEYYAKKIHLPFNSINYLKLFVYFSRYGMLPSHQMMPRFLGNLWASTQMLNQSSNPALYQVEPINKEATP